MHTKMCLAVEDVDLIVSACRGEAKRQGWNVCIAVVDESGTLLQLVRLDGAVSMTPDIATLKARTAASSGLPSKVIEEMCRERPAMLSVPGRLALQGAVPIHYRDVCVGAVGVSGARSAEDEQVANAGVLAFAAFQKGPGSKLP